MHGDRFCWAGTFLGACGYILIGQIELVQSISLCRGWRWSSVHCCPVLAYLTNKFGWPRRRFFVNAASSLSTVDELKEKLDLREKNSSSS